MIAISDPTPIDIILARNLHSRSGISYDLPNRRAIFSELVAYDEEGMIAYGGIELAPEGFLIVDSLASEYRRAKAITQLIEAGLQRLKEFDFNTMMTFTSDKDTERFLMKLGFSAMQEKVLFKKVK